MLESVDAMVNPFSLLTDEGASGDEAPVAVSKAPAKKPQTTPSTAQPRGKPREDYPSRGGARRVLNERNEDSEPQKREGKAPRGGKPSRGRGRTDRHSNTGRVDSDKAEHQGWGIKDDGKRELADEENGLKDAKDETVTPRGDGSATPAAAQEPTVEEEPVKTYEEYLAEQESTNLAEKLGLASISIRKPNEGADDAQWKNAKEFVREEDQVGFSVAAEKEAKSRKRPTKEGKTFIEVEARFPRPGADRGERGGRGGARGRGEGRGRGGDRAERGRGGPAAGPRPARQPKQQGPAVDTSDANAFPSLA